MSDETSILSYYQKTVAAYFALLSMQQPCLLALYDPEKPIAVYHTPDFDLGIRANGESPILAKQCFEKKQPLQKVFLSNESKLKRPYNVSVYPIWEQEVQVGVVGFYRPAFEEVRESLQTFGRSIDELKHLSEQTAASSAETADESQVLADRIQTFIMKTQEIAKLNSWIKEISAQTNMLGLNAAIEAARAGEHGRGFGIVAEEIRKLSIQVKQSSDSIAQQVQEIQKMAETVIDLVEHSLGNTQQQSAASEELSETVSHLTNSLHVIQNMANQVL